MALTRRTCLLLLLLSLSAVLLRAQQKYTVSGEVRDGETGEYLIGAMVSVKELKTGIATNVYGFYSLTLPAGQYTLTCQMLSYQSREWSLQLDHNIVLHMELMPVVTEGREVVIEAERRQNTESTDMGRVNLEMDQMKKLPALLGEVDILKTIALLPGVQSAGEGITGFYVRGGGIDQNLILLDNAPVYNASHLFGFFSVFNADAVKNLELIKGGVPPQYGGRLSSVLDIALKEGNSRAYHGEGGIGLIASRFTVEGPIKKDTSSFIISGRRTYIDVLAKPFIKKTSDLYGSGYYFYDLNAKLNYRLSDKDQLFVSGYFGRDVFSFSSESAGFKSTIPWGNATTTLRWKRVMNEKLFMNTIATFTDYKFEFTGSQESFEFSLRSGIRDYGLKAHWIYYPSITHQVRWGGEYTFHRFTPNSVYARSGDTEFNTGSIPRLFSHEVAVFAQDEWDITDRLRVRGGLRVSHFIHVGPFDRYIPQEQTDIFNQPLPPLVVQYQRGDKVADYTGWEPRINARYALNRNSSVKAGYTHNYQYIHLTSLSPTSLPTDVWLPSTDKLKPQKGIQYSLGYFRNLADDMFETSAEVYYKDMWNLAEFKEGAQPEQTVNDNIDNLLLQGSGYSYGLELFVKKRTGRLSGWVGYTLSKTMRRLEGINEGKEFPARWDRRHDASVVANYKLNDRLEFGFIFVYGTGSAIMLPLERYFFEGVIAVQYGPRNSFRMAPYHRADMSVTYYPKNLKKVKDHESGEWVEKKRRVESNWNFSVYNLYNRRNPYYYYFGTEGQLQEGNLQVKAYQVSLFPLLPSVTWNFKF